MEVLAHHIQKFIQVSEEELAEIVQYFKRLHVSKKKNLIVEGEICKHIYFVSKGLLRKFFINDKGIERTTEFALESWWMMDVLAFKHTSTTEFHIQAVEDCEILAITGENYKLLLKQHPSMEQYFRLIFEKAYGAMQMRIKFLYDFSREELYHHFRAQQPEFLQRVPQYLIASYLGFTPEYLSEIRKKNIS
ncbi:Crp/Fnr family transcriptional regulator [Sphingobacterium sp. LRF_L2]|uniref:Crp/Fnr family transcriptional regulator n=1 Tax=Sphingobacterium sp. LRF_L2 TaxID=3369421 RepID=UPI003F60F1A6